MTSAPVTTPSPRWRTRLIVVTAVGLTMVVILLLLAIGRRNDVEHRWQVLLADAARVVDAEEEAMARDGQYAAYLAPAGGADTARFTPSPDITVVFKRLTPTEWNAVVTDTALKVAPRHCGVFRGGPAASPHRAVVLPGTPACW